MDPRNDRTSVVRSRLLNIVSSRMQPTSATAVASGPPNSNAPSTIASLTSSEETAMGTTQDKSLPLPLVPPLPFGSVGPDETTRRALTPIREASGSERDPSRLPTVEAPVPTSPRLGDGTGANTTLAPPPLSSTEQREEPDVPRSTQISPSVYTPTEAVSVPVSPPHENPEESAIGTSIPKPNPEVGVSLTIGGPSGQLSYDDSRTLDVNEASSPPSARSLHSSAASPPSLSPANSSNPPASLSPAQAPPRTPSPKLSILTSPHSLDSPARPNQSFAEIGAESLGRQPLTSSTVLSAAASLEPTKLSQDYVQASTDSSPDMTHGIYDEAGALYYLHQSEHDSPESAREEDVHLSPKSHASQYVIVPVRPKTASPPPTASSAGHFSLASIDTAHRKPPIQPLPRTPTLDYGLERRPAGARAAPVSNRQESVSLSAHHPQRNLSTRIVGNVQQGDMSQEEDPDADAFAALTFLEQHSDDTSAAPSGPSTAASPPSHPREGPPTISEPYDVLLPNSEGENASAYRSSFAPSKNAMQRKARTEAQQAAHEAATHRPGRGTGKQKEKPKTVGTWGYSSEDEEEEEEEEEEDDDVDSDGQPVVLRDDRSASNYTASVNQRSLVSSPRGPSPLTGGVDAPSPSQQIPRPPRNLPPVPLPRGQGMSLTLSTLHVLVLMLSVV